MNSNTGWEIRLKKTDKKSTTSQTVKTEVQRWNKLEEKEKSNTTTTTNNTTRGNISGGIGQRKNT